MNTNRLLRTALVPGALAALLAAHGVRAEEAAATTPPAAAPPAATAPAAAPEAPPAKEWSATVSADVVSRYVWRGMLQNADPVVQPSATFTWKGLSLNVWQSWDTTHYGKDLYGNRKGKVEETDYTLGYSKTVLDGKLTLGGGVVHYTFPGTTLWSTTEVYASATVNTFLSPTLAVYHDIDESRGFYVTPSVSHTFTLNDKTNVVLAANMGWGDNANNEYYFKDSSGVTLYRNALVDYGLSAQLNYSVTPAFVISPYIKYSDFINGDVREGAKSYYSAKDSAQVVVGIRAAYTF